MANPHDTKRPESDGSERSPTEDLAARIARAREGQPAPRPPASVGGPGLTGASRGYRLASEFVAAIVVGGGLGYVIDLVAHTRPWAMIVLLLLGFAAGVRNIVRSAKEMTTSAAVPPGPAVADDEDD